MSKIEIENFKETLNDYRNSIKKGMTKHDLQEIDKFIIKVIDDVEPILELFARLPNDELELKLMKEYLEKIIQDEKWLEKLLKTS